VFPSKTLWSFSQLLYTEMSLFIRRTAILYKKIGTRFQHMSLTKSNVTSYQDVKRGGSYAIWFRH
jgi:hypothetical protein